MQRRTLIATLATLVLPSPRAQAMLPQPAAVPGGVVIIDLGAAAAPPTAQYNGRPVMVLARDGGGWNAVVGIALAADLQARHAIEVRENSA
jgi:hypothetical protein